MRFPISDEKERGRLYAKESARLYSIYRVGVQRFLSFQAFPISSGPLEKLAILRVIPVPILGLTPVSPVVYWL